MFDGIFEGLGHKISDVQIVDNMFSIEGDIGAGVFLTNSGTIRDIGVAGGSVICPNFCGAGGLVGNNIGISGPAIIFDAYATDSVAAPSEGGLVDENYSMNYNATISNSFAAGSLKCCGEAGGLVGIIESGNGVASIINSHATGSVSGDENSITGGLIGDVLLSGVLIENDYATGNVTGGYYAGGLVGYAIGATFTNVYATGAVSNAYYAGGLIGDSKYTSVNIAYATGSVSGSYYAGGLEGANLSGILDGTNLSGGITNAYATGAVTSGEYAGGLVGYNTATPGTLSISNTYAIGKVEGPIGGGLVGYNDGGLIDTSYWDRSTTGRAKDGQTVDGGDDAAKGLTTYQLQNGDAYFTGSAFAGGTDGLYPYLVALPPDTTP